MSGHQLQQQYRRRGSDVSLDGPGTSGRELEDDEQSIIDVFEFDDTAQDRWLCSLGSSRRNSIEEKVEDLDAWLHADVAEQEASQSDNGLKKSIDTRTFTRIKRRPNRLSFDGLEASGSSDSSPFSLSNVWKHQVIPESPQNNNNNNDKELIVQKERRDSIPMMLRPKTNQVLAAILSEGPSSISSQTSMEAFMNAARSKEGYNSMLSDISDPDVSHFLMNISQPSLLYSSIISDGKGDESLHVSGPDVRQMTDSMVDSQILTDSMMEASMFKEVQDTSMLAEFLRQNDCTILENKTFFKSPNESETNDKTYINDNLCDKTYVNGMDENLKNVNETFLANSNSKRNDTFTSFPSPIPKTEANLTKIISHEQSLDTTQIISDAMEAFNSTKTLKNCEVPVFQKQNVLSTTLTLDSENKTDLTYELSSAPSSPAKQRMDATYQASNFPAGQIPRLSGSTENSGNLLDATFNAIPNLRSELLQEVQRSSGNKYDATFTSAPLPRVEPKLDVTKERSSSSEALLSENLDATYVQVPSLQQPESQSANQPCLDVTYEPTQINSKLSNVAGTRRISYAKKNAIQSQMPLADQNRFNTYRKDNKIGGRLSKVPPAQDNQLNKANSATLLPNAPTSKSNDNLYQQRFSTFSKKTTSLLKNSIAAAANNAIENQEENKVAAKPANKIPKHWPAPRQLSKLPQLFQKSNPNLGTTMKLSGKLLESDATFNKGSQPNVSSNMYALGRFKSEQRLLQSKHSAEFPRNDGTSRSMESIESTASAHSAPDLDDRLSSCSDVSRGSYTVQSKNVEALKRLAGIEESSGKVGGSTPLVKGHQVLENTWVQERDLPSPIFKNGVDRYTESVENVIASPNEDSDFSAKTSSPLAISPAISDQAINAIGNDDGGIEATKENIQATENVPQQSRQLKIPNTVTAPANSTKLRRPTNWTGVANKVANGAASGIPRPASRIPAPKFSRPNLK